MSRIFVSFKIVKMSCARSTFDFHGLSHRAAGVSTDSLHPCGTADIKTTGVAGDSMGGKQRLPIEPLENLGQKDGQ